MRFLGYVTSRSFQGFTIPVPAQNACLREYAKSIDLTYVLPPLEYYFENCYMQLFTVIRTIKEGDIVGMYSAAMLPKDPQKLKQIFFEIEKRQGSLHFVLESKTVTNFQEAKSILYSYSLRNIFDGMSQIDVTLMRKLINK